MNPIVGFLLRRLETRLLALKPSQTDEHMLYSLTGMQSRDSCTLCYTPEDSCPFSIQLSENVRCDIHKHGVVRRLGCPPEAPHEVDNDDEEGGDGAVNGQV